MNWEKKFTWYILIVGLLIAVLFFTCGCSTTKEIVSRTEETTTVQPITVPVPAVHGDINNIPLAKPDTTDSEPYGVYEGEGNIVTKDPATGGSTEAKVKTTVTIKKNPKGKPIANVKIDVQQAPIKTEAKVIKSKTVTDSETKTEGIGFIISKYISWFVIFVIILAAIFVFLWFKKLLPTGWTSSITKLWKK